jgi:Leucine-rich repeat (LRR) protein
MTIKELQKNLLEAYSVKNLNYIALTLINLQKNQQYSILRKIAEIISDFVQIEITDEGKGFSKLMMLYHPDRAGFHVKEINNLAEQGNFDKLLEYSHILKLQQIEEIANSLDSYEDIDYSPVYEWDTDVEGFSIIKDNSSGTKTKTKTNSKARTYNFYDAIKIRQYGHTEIDFPTYYLEDFDEFELASCDIDDLDGVQFCVHAKRIDVSDNKIYDLLPLIGLTCIEELDLSDNKIHDIMILRSLVNLKSVNLSNNLIEDISPLLKLENLEYVDLSGNKVDLEKINELIELGVTVEY